MANSLLKLGVLGYGNLRPECLSVIQYIDDKFGGLIISAIGEGDHKAASKHYRDPIDAFDCRKYLVRHLGDVAEIVPLTREMLTRAAPDRMFDVVDEANHWHVEYDPK